MDFVTEKDKSLQIVCKFRQKRADKRLCDTSKQTFSYLKTKISRGVFNHSRGCSLKKPLCKNRRLNAADCIFICFSVSTIVDTVRRSEPNNPQIMLIDFAIILFATA